MARVVPLNSGIAYGTPGRRPAEHGLVGRLLRGLRTRIREQRLRSELRRLTDHQLRDIGLDRTQVAEPSWGAVAWEDVARLSLRAQGRGR